MEDNPALQLLGSTPALAVYYDVENQWLYASWQGAYETATAQQSAQLLVACAQMHPCQKLLNDTQHVTSSWRGQENWAGKTLFPMLAHAGIRFIACVYSEQWQARHSLEITMDYTTQPFITAFDDLAAAYRWLQRIGDPA
jgi:hypothetical protein